MFPEPGYPDQGPENGGVVSDDNIGKTEEGGPEDDRFVLRDGFAGGEGVFSSSGWFGTFDQAMVNNSGLLGGEGNIYRSAVRSFDFVYNVLRVFLKIVVSFKFSEDNRFKRSIPKPGLSAQSSNFRARLEVNSLLYIY
jgi:hypothetical protein